MKPLVADTVIKKQVAEHRSRGSETLPRFELLEVDLKCARHVYAAQMHQVVQHTLTILLVWVAID